MKYLLFGILTLSVILHSCSSNTEKEDKNELGSYISGTLENGRGNAILIQKLSPDRFRTLDSLVLDENSSFSTTIEIERPGFYAVRNEKGNYISFLLDKHDSIHIVSDYYNFNRFELSGSREVEEITRLNNATKDFLQEVSEYAKIISDSVNSPDYSSIKLETDKKYRAAFNELKNFSLDFIERNEGSMIALMALTNQLGRDFFVFDPIDDYQVFHRVDSILYEKYPESAAVQKIHSRIEMIKMNFPEKIKQIETGDVAPDFAIQNPDNKTRKLSELKGNIVLLDFWASWCAPCRERNKKLINLYQKYSDKGFEIFQVSLDIQHEDWVRAIREDKLNWFHGSELKFWDSEVAIMYGVNSIPSSFLINKDGIITGINLTTEEIENELKKL